MGDAAPVQTGGGAAGQRTGTVVEIVVRDVPVATYLASRRHIGRLLAEAARFRELAARDDVAAPHAEVVLALEELVAESGEQRLGVTHAVAAAAARGDEEIDVAYRLEVPRAMLLVVRIMDLLEEADQLCRQGTLRTPPADPDVRALRRRWRVALTAALVDHGVEVAA